MKIPLSEVDPGKTGGNYPAAGKFHVEVVKIDEDAVTDKGTKFMKVVYKILAGTPAEQEGKEQWDMFFLTAASMPRMVQFAIAIALTTVKEVQADKDAGRTPSIDFAGLAVGRQLCIETVPKEHEGKTRNKVEFGIWALDAPEAKDIPKDREALDRLGKEAVDPLADVDASSVFE